MVEDVSLVSFAQYQDEKNINSAALRVVNDDIVAPGKGFGAHEHHDMEILTYVLEGELEHRDSTGRRGVVTAGDAVPIAHLAQVEVKGNGLVVLWDIPPLRGGAQP